MSEPIPPQAISLRRLPLGDKLFFSAFLCLVGVGYLMALTLIYTVDAGRDGKPGISGRLGHFHPSSGFSGVVGAGVLDFSSAPFSRARLQPSTSR